MFYRLIIATTQSTCSGHFVEFETYIGDISVNGVDIIRWNDEGKIIDFKVMIRPLRAIGALQKKMSEALDKLSK